MKKRMLLVEDEWIIAIDHAEALRDSGFDVLGPVRSAVQALGLIEKAELDAALLDIRLDSETTYPVADALRRRGIPFAFVTGLTEADIDEPYRSSRILQKPVPRTDLIAVARLLTDD